MCNRIIMKDDVGCFRDQLRNVGLRVTPARVAVLQALTNQNSPTEVHGIMRGMKNSVNQATVYRILRVFTRAGLVKSVVIQGGGVRYELASLPHHHHVVCEKCGRMEDVEGCLVRGVPSNRSFAAITGHRLEFLGVCKKCA